jgi:N-acetylmuramoyl-L-alanine amidase
MVNRATLWGKSLAHICLQPYQFSCWLPTDPNRMVMADLPMNDPGLVAAREMVMNAIRGGNDPTLGASHYVNLAVANPPWVRHAKLTVIIGHHSFFKLT